MTPHRLILDQSRPRSQITPEILVLILILALILFLFCLIHFLARHLLRKHSPSSSQSQRTRRRGESVSPEALQRQLQQLFYLHDSGLDQASIDSLPVFHYNEIVKLKGDDDEEEEDGFDCAICLSEFGCVDKLRLLPACSHAFHVNCIDAWLLCNSSCPLCRSTLFFPGQHVENPAFELDDDEDGDGEKQVFPVKAENVGGLEGSSSRGLERRCCFTDGNDDDGDGDGEKGESSRRMERRNFMACDGDSDGVGRSDGVDEKQVFSLTLGREENLDGKGESSRRMEGKFNSMAFKHDGGEENGVFPLTVGKVRKEQNFGGKGIERCHDGDDGGGVSEDERRGFSLRQGKFREEENFGGLGESSRGFELAGDVGDERVVFPVRLGKVKKADGFKGDDEDGDGEKVVYPVRLGKCVEEESDGGIERCYSMGSSSQYVVAMEKRKGESFSVSKIWQWNEMKGKLPVVHCESSISFSARAS